MRQTYVCHLSLFCWFTNSQTESSTAVFLLVGMVMATFTAALQCCRMDSSLAGASICVSILAGCFCGTEGKSLYREYLSGSCCSLL